MPMSRAEMPLAGEGAPEPRRPVPDEARPGRRRNLLIFLTILAYLYFRGIGDHGLLDPLEGVNASVGLTMATHGDLLHPGVGEAPYAGRAMGTWWLYALALKAFGWEEFAVRFWPAAAGLGMALAAALASRGRGAWIAAAVSASMVMGFTVSHLASSHALYACCTAMSMAAFVRLQRGEGRRWALLAHAGALAALVVQGPEGLLLPWVVPILHSMLTSRFGPLALCWRHWPAALISLAGVSGYVALLAAQNPMILTLMLYEAPPLLRPGGMLSLLFILVSVVPWPGLVVRAVTGAVPRSLESLQGEEPTPRFFLVLWAFVFAFFAVMMGDYLSMAAAVPPLAALVGDSLDEWIEEGRVGEVQRAVALNIVIIVPLAALGLPLALRAIPGLDSAMLSLVPWLSFVALCVAAGWYYARTRQLLKFARNVSAAALLCLMPLTGVFDLLAEDGAIRDVGLALRGSVQRGDVIVQYAVNRPSMYFYTLRNYAMVNAPLVPGLTRQRGASLSDTALHLLWEDYGRAFLMIPRNQQLSAPLPGEVNALMEDDGMVVLSNRSAPLGAGSLSAR